MGGVWRRLSNEVAPHLVPLPNEHRITPECLGRRKIFGAKVPPEPFVATEGGNAAVRGDAGAGEDDHAAWSPFADRLDCLRHFTHRARGYLGVEGCLRRVEFHLLSSRADRGTWGAGARFLTFEPPPTQVPRYARDDSWVCTRLTP